MQRRSFMTAAALGVAFAGTTSAGLAVAQDGSSGGAPVAPRLRAAMQDLWHDHIVATRNYALAVHGDDKDAAEAAKKAEVDNGHALADAVASVYGDDAGKGIFDLLAGHVTGVNDLTDATKAGDQGAQDKAMDDLAANGKEIAQFLAGANPDNWTEDALFSALVAHVGHHKKQIDLIMSDAAQDEQDNEWTAMQEHMDMIAGVLTDGIAAQFPDKVN